MTRRMKADVSSAPSPVRPATANPRMRSDTQALMSTAGPALAWPRRASQAFRRIAGAAVGFEGAHHAAPASSSSARLATASGWWKAWIASFPVVG